MPPISIKNINISKYIRFTPGLDTILAFISVLVMTGIYYINFHYGYSHPAVFFIVFVLLGHILVCTIIPCYVVLWKNREGLKGLGIGWHNWKRSLSISVLIAAAAFPELNRLLDNQPTHVMLTHLTFNALLIWEILFLFSWLQTRFQKAFGSAVAPVLTSLGFVFYHVGSLDPSIFPLLFISGMVFTIAFAITNNILVLAPIAWAVNSGIGSLMGGYLGDSDGVVLYLGIVFIQLIILLYFFRASNHLKEART